MCANVVLSAHVARRAPLIERAASYAPKTAQTAPALPIVLQVTSLTPDNEPVHPNQSSVFGFNWLVDPDDAG